MPATRQETSLYYPKLDSVRCFAAFAVVFAHMFQIWTWDLRTGDFFPLGNVGVVVFFVLSGFLITKLLLREPVDQPLSRSFKNFYIRRTLRIFPIYYLYLVVVFTFNFGEIRDTGFAPWLYLTNIQIFSTGEWLTFNSPLWSLSVEEQFYLVWPFVVLFLRGRPGVLVAVLTGVCVLGIGARLYLFLVHGYSNTSPHIEVFTLTNIDFLGVGALLALAHHYRGERIAKYGLPLLVGGVVVHYLTVPLIGQPPAAEAIYWGFGKLSVAVAGAGLVLYSLHSNQRYTLLHNPVTIHLGKISYGVYLYHNIFVFHYRELSGLVGLNPARLVAYDPATNMIADPSVPLLPKVLGVIVCLAMVIAVAEASYWFIERPLLKLKDRYRTTAVGPGAAGEMLSPAAPKPFNLDRLIR